jgi:hypothetical protein
MSWDWSVQFLSRYAWYYLLYRLQITLDLGTLIIATEGALQITPDSKRCQSPSAAVTWHEGSVGLNICYAESFWFKQEGDINVSFTSVGRVELFSYHLVCRWICLWAWCSCWKHWCS